MIKSWFKSGSPWIWINAAGVSTSLIMVITVLGLIAFRGGSHFWPAEIVQLSYQDEDQGLQTIIGERVDMSVTPAKIAKISGFKMADDEHELVRYLIKIGNRDITGHDFRWIQARHIKDEQFPTDLVTIERREWGNFYGRIRGIKENGNVIAQGEAAWPVIQARLERASDLFAQIRRIEKSDIGAINYGLERLRLRERKLKLENRWDEEAAQKLAEEKKTFDIEFQQYQTSLVGLYQQIRRDSLLAETDSGRQVDISLAKVVRLFKPNDMNFFQKMGHYFVKVHEFITDEPREANTEGGIFPAIFGTVIMVLMMSVIVTPFGVVAAVYLREYAKQGFITRLIRVAVNNLAGVPSIVYGVFGLGFFVYIMGGKIDELFYPEAAPAPVFGTPGLLWASITLALLTLPVVIVSTEEGLTRIPRSIREGSLALGATKFETLWLTVLPMASPAMMTGLILAVARAAGEVAPLMLVGVVKMAPTLPLDGNFPFLHLDRKFMHLGFHIYDVGFQSPNVDAARPLVYATALLLVIVVLALNLTAIIIRNNLREKYRALEE